MSLNAAPLPTSTSASTPQDTAPMAPSSSTPHTLSPSHAEGVFTIPLPSWLDANLHTNTPMKGSSTQDNNAQETGSSGGIPNTPSTTLAATNPSCTSFALSTTNETETKTETEDEDDGVSHKHLLHLCTSTFHNLHTSATRPNPDPTADGLTVAAQQLWNTHIRQQLASVIYGSNYIERVGASHPITLSLCLRIWSGEDVQPSAISTTSPEYQQHLQDLQLRGPAANAYTDHDDVMRSRREITNHAHAFAYLLRHFLAPDSDTEGLSEELIRATHGILVQGLDIPPPENKWAPVHFSGPSHGTAWEDYAATYRKGGVRAGGHVFPEARLVPGLMGRLCGEFERGVRELEEGEGGWEKGGWEREVLRLAFRLKMDFVQVHPFMDGNGRMSRMLLNAVLLKYLGVTAAICGVVGEGGDGGDMEGEGEGGDDGEEKEREREREYEKYIGICIRAGERRKEAENEAMEKRGEGVEDDGAWFWSVEGGEEEFEEMVGEKCRESMRRLRWEMEGRSGTGRESRMCTL